MPPCDYEMCAMWMCGPHVGTWYCKRYCICTEPCIDTR